MKKIKLDLIFLAILLGGLLLRLHNLGRYSFWLDEAINLLLGPKYLWAGLMDQSFKTPELSLVSLFPFLVHFWEYLGRSEFVLRLLPLAFGVFSIIAIYMLAKLLFNKEIARFSAFILAVSPFHVYYSQELKYNTMIVFFSILSVYFYIKSLKEDKLIFWLAFIVFMLLDIYTFLITLSLLISLDAFYIFYFKKYKKIFHKWLIAQACILFFLIPWLIRILQQMSNPDPFPLSGYIQKPSLLTLFYSFQIFNIGYGASFLVGYFAVCLALVLFVFGILSIAAKNEETGLLLTCFLMPLFIHYIVSFVIKPIFLHRALIYVTPAYYILLACGFSPIKKNLLWVPIFLFTLLSFISLRNQFENILPLSFPDYRGSPGNQSPLNFSYYPGLFVKTENKSAADYIERNFQEGDVVGHIGFTSLLPFVYYHSKKLEEKVIGEKGYVNLLLYRLHSDPVLQNQFGFADINQFIKGRKRIWIVIFTVGASGKYREKMLRVDECLKKNCSLIDSKAFSGIRVELYQIKSG